MSLYSKIHAYSLQRIPSIALVAFLCLLVIALWPIPPYHDSNSEETPFSASLAKGKNNYDQINSSYSQLFLVFYIYFAHILGFAFPLRLCWSCCTLSKRLKTIAESLPLGNLTRFERYQKTEESGYSHDGYDSSSSSSSTVFSARLSESSDESILEKEDGDQLILHSIILPNYKEELDTLKETLDVLASHPNAKSCYEVVLAMEKAELGSSNKAALLIDLYARCFFKIDYTLHPQGIPGEAQGKSSNLCWAARYLVGKYEASDVEKDVIVTVIDSDSHLSERYFQGITDMHRHFPQTANTTIYVPPIIFDRNAHMVPRLVRVADILWAGAGLSSHYANSTICPPTSVYSLPLSLVERVGGWDAGEEAIGEDLHMYIKCFFAVKGNLTTRTVLSPASQSNVHTDGKGIRGFFKDVKVRYRQALRHMWGALDSGFVIISIQRMVLKSYKEVDGDRPHWMNTLVLLHRMYEAHFLPVHITLIMAAGSLYTMFTPAKLANPLLLKAFNLAGWLRLGSGLGFAIFFFLYEKYHFVCVRNRENEMRRVGLIERMCGSFSYRNVRNNCFDYCLFPIAGIAFGSFPTIIALLSHFWTLRLTYKVSKKPSRPALVV